MDARQPDLDLRSAVIVPARPGAVVPLRDHERGRDEIDELVDDVFGEPDDRGPGPVDVVLITGGLSAIIAGQAASLPPVVTVLGAIAFALGSVLPLRSLWQRAGSARRARRFQSLLGDGLLLRIDHPGIEALLVAHRRLLGVSAPLAAEPRARVHDVAHAALVEVASLLGGRRPGSQEELDYVAARTHALDGLAAAVTDPRVGDGDVDRRRALVEARHEVEQLAGGSSLTDAADLSRELLRTDEA